MKLFFVGNYIWGYSSQFRISETILLFYPGVQKCLVTLLRPQTISSRMESVERRFSKALLGEARQWSNVIRNAKPCDYLEGLFLSF